MRGRFGANCWPSVILVRFLVAIFSQLQRSHQAIWITRLCPAFPFPCSEEANLQMSWEAADRVSKAHLSQVSGSDVLKSYVGVRNLLWHVARISGVLLGCGPPWRPCGQIGTCRQSRHHTWYILNSCIPVGR